MDCPISSRSKKTRPRATRAARADGIALALVLIGAVGAWIGCGSDRPDRPNLVLITMDRLAADRLHCFGGPLDAGRSVCALGRHGTLHAWTVSPARGEASGAATALTGLPEAVHGLGRDGQSFLADIHSTIAEDLSKAGYATAAFVDSPKVNRSRRLDRGFDLYEDRLASPSRMEKANARATETDLSVLIRRWIDGASSPWFVWVHVNREAGLAELEHLLTRLSGTLDPRPGAPGVLFLALAGEAESIKTQGAERDSDQGISWRMHRVPLIWRPPSSEGALPNSATHRVSQLLASPLDVLPTLRSAAELPSTTQHGHLDETSPDPKTILASGRDLNRDIMSRSDADANVDESEERFLLLESNRVGGEVGLASQKHLYIRLASPLDGTGRPVGSASLIPLGARFASLPKRIDAMDESAPQNARLEPGRFRTDVLHAESPVSRLEFHLARRLGAQQNARRIARNRKNLQ